MRQQSPAAGQSDADIPIDRYFSKAWHDQEVEKVWRKTWQLACRVELIPDVGDQNTDNLMRIQRGLRASRKPGVTLARYQESRIRHYHATLDAYIAR